MNLDREVQEPNKIFLGRRRARVRVAAVLSVAAMVIGGAASASLFPSFLVGIISFLDGPVPADEIIPDVPVDGIPPLFVAVNESSYGDDDMVVGVAIDGEAFAYPFSIMNFHELVEHDIAGHRMVATYCPLTNSAALFEAADIDFGNTGSLYNNNVVMYDRQTFSTWSQMGLGSIFGDRAGEHLTPLPVSQTTLGVWKQLHPGTRVLSEETGFSGRNYLSNVFVDFGYTEDTRIFFPQAPEIDPRRHPKEMVFGLARGDGTSIAFMYSDLAKVRVANQVFDGNDIVVFYEPKGRLAQGFVRESGDQLLHFFYSGLDERSGLSLFEDVETGSTWNVKGQPAGPLAGQRLVQIGTYSAYWFGWASFWPLTEIWDGSNIEPPTAIEDESWGSIKLTTISGAGMESASP